MPLQKCMKDGKSGWRWGEEGVCYIGPGAKEKALKQGRAIKASQAIRNQGDEVMPYPNEHAIRLNDPDKYVRIRRQNDKFAPGIHAIFGVTKGADPTTELQAIRFDAKKFTVAQAKAWLKDHDYKTTGFEEATGEMNNMETITFNLSSPVRHDRMGGKEYIVAPMVMITEGVHKGSCGPLFYPRTELSKTPQVWNHKPIVVYHPERNGQGVSACDPDIITSRGVGVVMNTRWDDKAGKLRAEAWFEKSRMDRVDDRIRPHLEENKMMEISTGLYADYQVESSSFNGEQYDTVATNYRPDHLALLPDKIGACSIKDGAGLLQLNESSELELITLIEDSFSDAEWKNDVCDLIKNAEMTAAQINDLPDSAFAIILPSGKKDEQGKTVPRALRKMPIHDAEHTKNAIARLNQADVTAAQRKVAFRKILAAADKFDITVSPAVKRKYGVSNQRKEHVMAKEKLVADLIKNKATKWESDDEEFLMSLEESQLEKMIPVANDDPEPKSEPEPEPKPEPEPEPKPVTQEEYIKNAPPEIRDLLTNALIRQKEEKDRMIKAILDNERNKFNEEWLQQQTIEMLTGLAALAAKPNVTPTYSGAAGPAPTLANEKVKPLGLPVINFEKKAS